MSESKPVLTYTVRRERSNGHYSVVLTISAMTEQRINDVIAGCVGNKAGYCGGQEAADKVMVRMARLRDAFGETVVLKSAVGMGAPLSKALTLEWQEYEGQGGHMSYCDHHLDLSYYRFGETAQVVDFLRRVGKRVLRLRGRGSDDMGDYALNNPTDVIRALEAMGAKRMTLWRDSYDKFNSEWVYASQDRPVLYTDPINPGDAVSVAAWGDRYSGKATFVTLIPSPNENDSSQWARVRDDKGATYDIPASLLCNLTDTWPGREAAA